jgi:hypothetical protein
MNYGDYLKSADWKRKRAKKFSRKRRCAICGAVENLQVHHLNYKNLYDVVNSDLRVLCERCHKTTHDLMKRHIIVFKNKNHQSRFAIIKNRVKKELKLNRRNLFFRKEIKTLKDKKFDLLNEYREMLELEYT